MTTIAWDGHTLAGDRRVAYGDTPMVTSFPKVRRVVAPNKRVALIGFSGSAAFASAFLAWLKGGERPSFRVDNSWTVMLIDDRKGVWVRSSTSDAWELVGRRVNWAIGSGCDYALGAMHVGADAARAVRAAAGLDVNTGFGVDKVCF